MNEAQYFEQFVGDTEVIEEFAIHESCFVDRRTLAFQQTVYNHFAEWVQAFSWYRGYRYDRPRLFILAIHNSTSTTILLDKIEELMREPH